MTVIAWGMGMVAMSGLWSIWLFWNMYRNECREDGTDSWLGHWLPAQWLAGITINGALTLTIVGFVVSVSRLPHYADVVFIP